VQLSLGADGLERCWWGAEPETYRLYHDEEWGRASVDESALFEKICLEGFQAGLSWLTILRKRDRFRDVFAGFAPAIVAGFDASDVARLLDDPGIVRHRGKIESTINNASRAMGMIESEGSLAAYFWSYAPPEQPPPTEIPAFTEASSLMSRDLKRRGWTFVGPTTVYAFMQAMGLVNDHLGGCHVRNACQDRRRNILKRL
jgi:DNA-3-methyladenine glycosylase I